MQNPFKMIIMEVCIKYLDKAKTHLKRGFHLSIIPPPLTMNK